MGYQKLIVIWGFLLISLCVCIPAKRSYSAEIIGVFYNISNDVTSFEHVNVTITNSKVANLHVIFNEDLTTIPGKASFNMISKSSRPIVIFQLQSDICRILEEGSKNKFISMFMKEFLRKSNIPRKCPLRKNVEYYVKNYTLDENDYPPYVPPSEWHFNLNIKPNNIGTVNVSLRIRTRNV